ncbi:uncharacterized protein LOC131944954 isoform X2 [Physella acuta]|uniref:uncharacterized protein LOC131944954 isoform X2 n=1 Tax=Physella acuta TaxID=109671 RepID=UPI0027DD549E|nr:uncharacterized protein LOC131944954 isoform X2 [Physella acuta]
MNRFIHIAVTRMKTLTVSRGAFIVVEGCDRCGKSTQCSKIMDRLKAEGTVAELLKFPDRTTITGKMIDSYLKMSEEMDDRAIHLLFSSNRWEALALMEKKLKSGVTLIADRYAYSGVAYSTAKGLDMDWCKAPDSGLIKPDAVLYLNVSNDVAAQRSDYGGERYEKRELQQRVHNIFLQLFDSSYWKSVNGDSNVEEVHEDIYKFVRTTIEESEYKPLCKLWT